MIWSAIDNPLFFRRILAQLSKWVTFCHRHILDQFWIKIYALKKAKRKNGFRLALFTSGNSNCISRFMSNLRMIKGGL